MPVIATNIHVYSGIPEGTIYMPTGDPSDPDNQECGAAIADNLSRGVAAWINGELVIGNGADNDANYHKGYIDGFAEAEAGMNIEYTYHTHTGSSSEGTGCYTTPVYHKHVESCYNHETRPAGAHKQGDLYICNGCGTVLGTSDWGGNHCQSTVRTSLKCGKSNTIESYSIGCGMAEGDIESATITFTHGEP